MAVKALVPDPGGFKSARHFAAWIGLTPKAHSSGGKERLGRISKMGNPELRSLLVTGAASVLRHVRTDDKARPWLKDLLGRRPFKVVAVALANKTGDLGSVDQRWSIPQPNGNKGERDPRLRIRTARTSRPARAGRSEVHKQTMNPRDEIPKQDRPKPVTRTKRAPLIQPLLREFHRGQRSCAAQKGRTYDRTAIMW